MNILFKPGRIGTLELPNRLVRSATAEAMADDGGRPRPALLQLYRELARGGVGLIISGHFFVHPSGKAHAEMTGAHDDRLVPALAELADAVHQEGGRLVAQINHGGVQCHRDVTDSVMGPSPFDPPWQEVPVRPMTEGQIETIIDAYGQAARRVQEASFDGVQIHAAHGYLIGQFLSPFVNRRGDRWGGDLSGRTRFLTEVSRAIRDQVGLDYPVLIKLGMLDGMDGGLTVAEGVQVAAKLAATGIDGVELSGGMGGASSMNTIPGIRTEGDEAYFRPLAQEVRPVTDLPILLVGGMRSRRVMEEVLTSGDADFISLCRPLIAEPDFPNRLRAGAQDRSACISGGRCWPEQAGEGMGCKCEIKVTD